MENQLRETAKKLLTEGTVQVVIGYGVVETGRVGAIFVTKPEEADRLVWNEFCDQNLAVYLTRKEVKRLGKAAIVVKPCDARSVVVLMNESQVKKEDVVTLGVVCGGMRNHQKRPCSRCKICFSHVPQNVDFTIGDPASAPADLSKEERRKIGKFNRIDEIMSLPLEERLDYWKKEFSRCVRCYACRQSCPLCYCNQCVADKNKPVRIRTSASLSGNFAWNILRAFHLAGRCVGCGACSAACPAGIDLNLINLTLATAAEDEFQYISGTQTGALPLIGSFAEDDKEDFIR